jgi:ribosomal protein S18 acetylase RimI-like enzyme
MDFPQLSPEEAAVRRYVEELRVPYQRELAETVEAFGLADDANLPDEEVDFLQNRMESDDFAVVVAVDSDDETTVDTNIATTDGTLAGFVTTERDEAPEVFTRPDRLIVCDLYVGDQYRGSGLARELIAEAADRAAVGDCPEVALDVDVDNGRAKRFYEKLGFETLRERLVVETDDIR